MRDKKDAGVLVAIFSQSSLPFASNNPDILFEHPHLHSFFSSWELCEVAAVIPLQIHYSWEF